LKGYFSFSGLLRRFAPRNDDRRFSKDNTIPLSRAQRSNPAISPPSSSLRGAQRRGNPENESHISNVVHTKQRRHSFAAHHFFLKNICILNFNLTFWPYAVNYGTIVECAVIFTYAPGLKVENKK
jgi:hypothetical protein